jgi:hypothetical protein
MVALFLILLLAVAAALPLMFQISAASRGDSRRHLNIAAQAEAVSRTGLDETLAWFRRQNQPVHANNHAVYKNDADETVEFTYTDEPFMPRGGDTLRPDIGLVRQYPLSADSGLWARFQVNRATNAASTDPSAVRDITDKYLSGTAPDGSSWTGAGLCWSLESLGVVFKPKNPISETAYYDFKEDEVVSRSRSCTEMRCIMPSLFQAPLVVHSADRVYLPDHPNMQLAAGPSNVALAYVEPDAHSRDAEFAAVFSSGAVKTAITTPLTIYNTFGVPLSTLKGLADLYVKGSALPTAVDAYPDYGLIFIDGDANFDETHPFPRSGTVVVNGNVRKGAEWVDGSRWETRPTANASFTGLFYVTGNLTINGPGLFSGITAVEGAVLFLAAGGSLELWYDSAAMDFAMRRLGQYRQDRSVTFVKRGISS